MVSPSGHHEYRYCVGTSNRVGRGIFHFIAGTAGDGLNQILGLSITRGIDNDQFVRQPGLPIQRFDKTGKILSAVFGADDNRCVFLGHGLMMAFPNGPIVVVDQGRDGQLRRQRLDAQSGILFYFLLFGFGQILTSFRWTRAMIADHPAGIKIRLLRP